MAASEHRLDGIVPLKELPWRASLVSFLQSPNSSSGIVPPSKLSLRSNVSDIRGQILSSKNNAH